MADRKPNKVPDRKRVVKKPLRSLPPQRVAPPRDWIQGDDLKAVTAKKARPSHKAVLKWVSSMAGKEYKNMKETSDVVYALQMLYNLCPQFIKLEKVAFNPKGNYEVVENLKLLKLAFEQAGIKYMKVSVDELAKESIATNLDFCITIMDFYDANANDEDRAILNPEQTRREGIERAKQIRAIETARRMKQIARRESSDPTPFEAPKPGLPMGGTGSIRLIGKPSASFKKSHIAITLEKLKCHQQALAIFKTRLERVNDAVLDFLEFIDKEGRKPSKAELMVVEVVGDTVRGIGIDDQDELSDEVDQLVKLKLSDDPEEGDENEGASGATNNQKVAQDQVGTTALMNKPVAGKPSLPTKAPASTKPPLPNKEAGSAKSPVTTKGAVSGKPTGNPGLPPKK